MCANNSVVVVKGKNAGSVFEPLINFTQTGCGGNLVLVIADCRDFFLL